MNDFIPDTKQRFGWNTKLMTLNSSLKKLGYACNCVPNWNLKKLQEYLLSLINNSMQLQKDLSSIMEEVSQCPK